MSPPASLKAVSSLATSTTGGDLTVNTDKNPQPSPRSPTTREGGSTAGPLESYTREELALGHAAESLSYYLAAKNQKAKDQKALAELTEPPSPLYYHMSDTEYEQLIATNGAAASRDLERAKEFDPSLDSVASMMVTDHQVSEADVRVAFNELGEK